MKDAKILREGLLRELSGIRQENEARIEHPPIIGSTGHNVAAWSEKGFERAMIIIGLNAPLDSESLSDYSVRLEALLKSEQALFVRDLADEGGGAADALAEALQMLDNLTS